MCVMSVSNARENSTFPLNSVNLYVITEIFTISNTSIDLTRSHVSIYPVINTLSDT